MCSLIHLGHSWSTYQIQVFFRRAGFKHHDSAQHFKKKENKLSQPNPSIPIYHCLCWLEHILQQQGTTRGRSRLRCRWHLRRRGRRSRRGLRVVRGRSQAHHGWDARATVGLEGQLPKAKLRLIEIRSFYSFCKIVSVYIYIWIYSIYILYMIKIGKDVRCHPKILTTAWNEIEEFLFWGGLSGTVFGILPHL